MALCELPDELLVHIIEQIGHDHKTLRRVALTSSRMQALAEPLLYRSLFLRKANEADAIYRALVKRETRGEAIHVVDARLAYVGGRTDYTALSDILIRAINLRELTIESPYCNHELWRRPRAGAPWAATMQLLMQPIVDAAILPRLTPQALNPQGLPLQRLTSLTLHLSGLNREFWTADGLYAAVFAHPVLQRLHLSSANLPDNTTMLMPSDVKTPLQYLALDECNVTMKGLRSVLSLPTHLQYLYLGENRYSPDEKNYPPGQDYNRLYERHPLPFLEALSQQQHSLQTLIYSPSFRQSTGRTGPHRVPNNPGLSAFKQLREVELDASSAFLRDLLQSELTSPPQLTRLSITDIVYHLVCFQFPNEPNSTPTWLRDIVSALPRLAELQLKVDNYVERRENDPAVALGDFLKQRHIAFRVLNQPSETSCVRPFLYGEKSEGEQLVYINDGRGAVDKNASDYDAWPDLPGASVDSYESGSEWEDVDDD